MPSVIEQCTQALQEGHCASARDLASGALAGTAAPTARLPLLELLAQAQVGLHDHEAAAQTWQQAYDVATTPAEKARLFELAALAYQYLQDYGALLRLAQAQLPQARSTQERAACLLVQQHAEDFPCCKPGNLFSRKLDGRTRAWVAGDARAAVTKSEAPKPAQFHVVPLAQGARDALQEQIDYRGHLVLRELKSCRQLVHKCCLCHRRISRAGGDHHRVSDHGREEA